MEILDSGERREFESGAVRDIQEGKGRCDLLPLAEVAEILKILDADFEPLDYIAMLIKPPHSLKSDKELAYRAIVSFCKDNKWDIVTALLEVAKHFEDGCKKYGERNWEKGIPAHCYIDSAVRHYLKWERGDTDEPHDRAFVWNMLCFAWTIENRPECRDLPGDTHGNGGQT